MNRIPILSPIAVFLHLLALHAILLWIIAFPTVIGEPYVQPELQPAQTEPEVTDIEIELDAPLLPEEPAQPKEPENVEGPGPLDMGHVSEKNGRLIADLGHQWQGELTIQPHLQRKAESILARAKVPYGAIVLIEVDTGRVLTMAERNVQEHPIAPIMEEGRPTHIALRALAPAASVFKIVTAAALLEAGLSPTKQYDYILAPRRIQKEHISSDKDLQKSDLASALATSNNGFFARHSNRLLSKDDLEQIAYRFGFNRVITFPLLIDASTAQVPRNDLERARMASGFWHTKLTVLHAALIGAAIAGNGTLPAPHLVERLRAPNGRIIEEPESAAAAPGIKPEIAAYLRTELQETVTQGTAREAFKNWPKSLENIVIGGKTGSLNTRDQQHLTSFTWFVGYTLPSEPNEPKLAFAVMVANDDRWWQRAPQVARTFIEFALTAKPDPIVIPEEKPVEVAEIKEESQPENAEVTAQNAEKAELSEPKAAEQPEIKEETKSTPKQNNKPIQLTEESEDAPIPPGQSGKRKKTKSLKSKKKNPDFSHLPTLSDLDSPPPAKPKPAPAPAAKPALPPSDDEDLP